MNTTTNNTTNLCHDLPHSEESEKCLLASLLLNPEAVTSTFQHIGHDSFYDLRHKLICPTIAEMAAARKHGPIQMFATDIDEEALQCAA